MRILILGGSGMLGHRLYTYLKDRHKVRVTLRKDISAYKKFNLFSYQNAYPEIDVCSIENLQGVIDDFSPQVVVNAVGIVKQLASAKESIPSIELNSLFPHRLALLCKENNARVIHLSTDCVFTGKTGNYTEEDPADAEDLYGRSKLLGELREDHCLTLRTSMIGKELIRKKSLLEWFLSQRGLVNGFTKAIFTGFTTTELSRIIEMLAIKYPEASGLYHVSSEPISKYDLLCLIKRGLNLPTEILPDDSFVCDRSLDSSKFRRRFNYRPPPWGQMAKELCEEIIQTEIFQKCEI